MARRSDRDPPTAGVVRRPPGERRAVPPEIDDLASGRTDRLPAPKRRPRLRDPRAVALVPGVANRDARALFDARAAELREALAAAGPQDPVSSARLAEGLAEAVLLGVWRGRSLTGLDVFALDILGLDAAEAQQLAEHGAKELGVPCERLSDEAVATWMRAEVALRESELPGRVRVDVHPDGEVVRIEVEVAGAPEALEAIGRRVATLARDQRR